VSRAYLVNGHLLRPTRIGGFLRSFRLHSPHYARETIAEIHSMGVALATMPINKIRSTSTSLETGRRNRWRMRPALLLATVWTAAALTGCSGLFHSDARPEQVYYLRATPGPQGLAPIATSLRLNRPSAGPGLEGTQIKLVQSDRRMSFYQEARWSGTPASLVEMLAVEKFRGSGVWQSVADSTSPFPSDYVLLVNVRRFEADYTGGTVAPEVHVVLDCIIGKREGREVIKSFLAEGSVPAAANRVSAVVAAFETATNAALDSMETQTLEAVRPVLGK
jgi:cholesterol transport system auxiliary component